jgi:hypothetical protein
MKRLYLIVTMLLITISVFGQESKTGEDPINSFGYNRYKLQPPSTLSSEEFETILSESIAATVWFRDNGTEYILMQGQHFNDGPKLPFVRLKKSDSQFEFDIQMETPLGNVRNHAFLPDGIAFAEHGLELGGADNWPNWPHGHIWKYEYGSDSLIQISEDLSFYHDITTGDYNNDGLVDIAAVHMGSKGDNVDGITNLHFFTNVGVGYAQESLSYIDAQEFQRQGSGALLLEDVNQDGQLELLVGNYKVYDDDYRYSIDVYEWNDSEGRFLFNEVVQPLGVFADTKNGATTIRSSDFDGDGDIDLIIAYENTEDPMGFEIRLQENGVFEPSQYFEWSMADFMFREFNLIDIDHDGDKDIVVNPWAGNLAFDWGIDREFQLHNSIFVNNGGSFSKYQGEVKIPTSLDERPFHCKSYDDIGLNFVCFTWNDVEKTPYVYDVFFNIITLSSPSNESTGETLTPTLSWSEDSNFDSYTIQVSTDGFESFVVNESVSDTSFTTPELEYDIEYSWRVRGSNSSADGEWSETWTFTTQVEPVGSITLSSPSNESTGVTLTPTLSWSEDTKADSYTLHVSTDGFESFVVNESLTETFFTTSELEYNTEYSWRVRGTNASGDGDYGEVWTFTTQYRQLSPSTPLNPQDEQDNVGTLTDFNWSEVDSVESYHLQVSSESSFSTLSFETTKLDSTSYILTEPLEQNTQYYWRVRSLGEVEQQHSEWSDVLSFTTGVRTSVEEVVPTEYSLNQNYPNPFNPTTTITYSLPQSGMVTLNVYDITGRFVTTLVNSAKGAGVHTVEFDANALSSGMYVYTLETDGYRQTRQMMLVK